MSPKSAHTMNHALILVVSTTTVVLIATMQRRCASRLRAARRIGVQKIFVCTLEDLPADALMRVVAQCDSVALRQAAAVSKEWSAVIREGKLWRAHVHKVSRASLPRMQEAADDAEAFCRGALRTWNVGWRVCYELMRTAHTCEEFDVAALRRLESEYEFIVDVLDVYSGHLWGSAKASLTNTPFASSNTRKSLAEFNFGIYQLNQTTCGNRVQHPPQLLYGEKHIAVQTGGDGFVRRVVMESQGLVINVFARRRADGRVAHVLRMSPDQHDPFPALKTMPDDDDPSFGVSQLCGVPLRCAPPRCGGHALRAAHEGVAWLGALDMTTYAPFNASTSLECRVRLYGRLIDSEWLHGIDRIFETHGESAESVTCGMLEKLLHSKDLFTWMTPEGM